MPNAKIIQTYIREKKIFYQEQAKMEMEGTLKKSVDSVGSLASQKTLKN
jgi:hypothetical protein